LTLSVVVGSVLALINHGDALLGGRVDGPRWTRIALTYMVPYLVSTWSSVAALLHKPGAEDEVPTFLDPDGPR
jgi:hypothetical protein